MSCFEIMPAVDLRVAAPSAAEMTRATVSYEKRGCAQETPSDKR